MAKQENTQEFSMSAVDKTTAFIEKNKKIFIGVIAAIIIIAGGIYAYQTLVVKPNEEKASYLLSKGQSYFAIGNFDLALNGDKTDFAMHRKETQRMPLNFWKSLTLKVIK